MIRANTGSSRIEVAVFTSTALVQDGCRAHGLGGTSAIALGRLLTATALVGLTSKRPGVTSIQILSQSRIGQVFADVTEHGWLRGYVRNTTLNYPLILNEDLEGRRTIGPAVVPGQVSVVRMGERGQYMQSATPLRDGEVDTDVDHFLNQSDQVASVLRTDVLMSKYGDIKAAGGILVQALPDTRLEDMQAVQSVLEGGLVTRGLREGWEAEALLESVAPGAVETDPRIVPIWRCRCSREKVLSTLNMLDAMELASMVAEDRPVEVKCELCNTEHVIPLNEVEEIMKNKTSARS
ncbi:MAG: Hsp33 family molecular chaperone HslO [Myxococcota bacterium]